MARISRLVEEVRSKAYGQPGPSRISSAIAGPPPQQPGGTRTAEGRGFQVAVCCPRFRWDAPTFFANAELFRERALDALAAAQKRCDRAWRQGRASTCPLPTSWGSWMIPFTERASSCFAESGQTGRNATVLE